MGSLRAALLVDIEIAVLELVVEAHVVHPFEEFVVLRSAHRRRNRGLRTEDPCRFPFHALSCLPVTDHLLLDLDAAVELHTTMHATADALDGDRRALAGPMADAAALIGSSGVDPGPSLRSVSDMLRREAHDLARRIRMVAAGGPDINAGLGALDLLAANWSAIDNRGRPDGNDGIVSRSDLEWAVDHAEPAMAAAARWLLDHDSFFDAVETAQRNRRYLSDGSSGFGTREHGRDGRISLADLESFHDKLHTWATLAPVLTATGDVDEPGVRTKAHIEAIRDDPSVPVTIREAAAEVLERGDVHDEGNDPFVVGVGLEMEAAWGAGATHEWMLLFDQQGIGWGVTTGAEVGNDRGASAMAAVSFSTADTIEAVSGRSACVEVAANPRPTEEVAVEICRGDHGAWEFEWAYGLTTPGGPPLAVSTHGQETTTGRIVDWETLERFDTTPEVLTALYRFGRDDTVQHAARSAIDEGVDLLTDLFAAPLTRGW